METDIIINGDSQTVLKTIPDNSIDVVITSPPYDDLRSYNGVGTTWNHNVFMNVANELKRVLKDGGVIVWNVYDKTENGSKSGTSLRQCLYFQEIGLNIHDYMMWVKTNPMPVINQSRYTPKMEFMFILSKGKPKTFNPLKRACKNAGKEYNSTAKDMDGEGGRHELHYNVNKTMIDYNVWEMAVAQNRNEIEIEKDGKIEKIKHPAVFPYELPYKHILSWSNEGDVILDPFVGSGTTAIAARDLNRHYIGIEKNAEYCEICKRRLSGEIVNKLF